MPFQRKFDHAAAVARVCRGEPVKLVAVDLGVSVAAIHIAFKKAYGMTYGDWIAKRLAQVAHIPWEEAP
jgi:hypothetical protein